MAKAIVTLVIGDKHRNLWQKLALPSWQRYAARHGYEIIAIERPLDDSEFAKRRNVTWQKLLILDYPEVRRFERVLWLDSDIVINDITAPCPVNQTPAELVDAVADQGAFVSSRLAGPFSRINHWQAHRRRTGPGGLPDQRIGKPAADFYLNSGTLVLSRDHRALLSRGVCRVGGRRKALRRAVLPILDFATASFISSTGSTFQPTVARLQARELCHAPHCSINAVALHRHGAEQLFLSPLRRPASRYGAV